MPKLDQHVPDAELQAWLADRVDADQAELIERHLEHCDECALRLEQQPTPPDPLLVEVREAFQTVAAWGYCADPDPSLRFGVLALETDLIDAAQFVDACRNWGGRRPDQSLGDVLVERGYLTAEQRDRLLRAVGLADLDNPQTQASTQNSEPNELLDRQPASLQKKELFSLGGMGKIWLAEDRLLGREVAIKELRGEYAYSQGARARFRREARIAAQLRHPGFVPVYGYYEESDRCYYTMQFVRGQTLAEVIAAYHHNARDQAVHEIELIDILNDILAVCNTVAYAHSQGIIHRDLKGDNIVVGKYGEVFVLDWGLAKQLTNTFTLDGAPGVQIDSPDSSVTTAYGQRLGTPAYMPPEQALGEIEKVDFRSDVYSLAALLYEALCGQPPFVGKTVIEVLRQVEHATPTPPSQIRADVPHRLEEICLRSLSKQREDRHQSADEFRQAIRDWMNSQLAGAMS